VSLEKEGINNERAMVMFGGGMKRDEVEKDVEYGKHESHGSTSEALE
jgi:hypothetical protein